MPNKVNNEYRAADYERWSKQGFTVGIEIKRSKSAKCSCGLCDNMNGIYPKTFKFQGWCENCICYAFPINLEGEDYLQYFFSGVVPEDKIIKTVPTKALEYINNNYEDLKNYYWADELLKLSSL